MSDKHFRKIIAAIAENLNDDSDETKEPIRTLPLSAKAASFVEKGDEKREKMKEEADKLIDRLKEIVREVDEMNEGLWAIVNTDMGLSSSRYRMTIDSKDKMLEILEDKWVDKE